MDNGGLNHADKKSEKSERDDREVPEGNEGRISLDEVTISAIDRGLSLSDVKKMELGHILDYFIEYNRVHSIEDEEEEKPKKRKAQQGDWNSLFG